jgi:NDP-sugar pyrophosphorylase family protein
MSANDHLKALLLVGGLGKRLRPVVSSVPKPLAQVGASSFLDLLVEQLRCQGIRKIVMCTGYLGEQIESEFGNGGSREVSIEYSRELIPMGTGGAVKLAESLLEGAREFLVMNGDSFIEVEFNRLIQFHRSQGGIATLTVSRVEDSARFGTVDLDERGRVLGFAEKTGQSVPGVINAGVYVFNRALMDYIPEGQSSLEREVFPHVLGRGVFALEQPGMFIDIGTPEDYALARKQSELLKESAAARSGGSL